MSETQDVPLTQEKINLLLIDDTADDAAWLQQILDLEAPDCDFHLDWVTDLQAGLNNLLARSVLCESGCDAVLLNLDLPDSQGLETLNRVQRLNPDCPVVVLTASPDEAIASLAMQAGAQDCLVKGQVNGLELGRALRRSVQRMRFDLTLRRRVRELQALYDTSLEINTQTDTGALLQALVERATRLLGMQMGGLYIVSPDGASLSMDYVFNTENNYRGVVLKMGEGLAGRVAQTGKLLAVDDYQNWDGQAPVYSNASFRRTLAVPLKIEGRVIGVIDLSDGQRTGNWSEDEIRLANLFADQAAAAIQKARLLEAERQKSAELARSNAIIASLSQVAGRLSATLDPQQILVTLGSELKLLGVTVQVSLFEGDPPQLFVRYLSVESQVIELAETMLGQKIIGSRIPENVWPAAERLADHKAIFVTDSIPPLSATYRQAPLSVLEFAMARLNFSHHTPCFYLPLIIKELPLGMMLVWGGDLRRDDLPTFNVFANQVAVALENARLYHRIERQATLDELTGLYNRRGFFMLAEQQMRVALRAGAELLLIFIDVDHLKLINDTLGHKEGDRALVQTAEALGATFRSADILARISGDEFAVLAYPSAGTGATLLMDRLKHEVERVNTNPPSPFVLSLSAGYAIWSPGLPISLDELLAQADAQMYQVKRKRRTGELDPSNVPPSEGTQ